MTTSALTAERIAHLQDLLTDCADLGHRLARVAVEQAETATLPLKQATAAYDQATRCIRRCAWLVGKLAEPIATRTAARKQIIRTVEDTIQRKPRDDADDLHEELMDRLDKPDLDDEIDTRAIDDIIADIVRDLGLADHLGLHPWKRRTPKDVATLIARATQPPQPRAAPTVVATPTQVAVSTAVGCNSS